MYILSQNIQSLTSLHHVHTFSCSSLPCRQRHIVFYCTTSNTKSTPILSTKILNEPNLKTSDSTRSLSGTYIDGGMFSCMEQLSTSSKSGGVRQDDPTMRSTWSQRAWVVSGCTSVLISLAKSFAIGGGADDSRVWLAGLIGYVMADLGSGVYHWGIDNYGSAKTPVFGSQIEAFQGHHRWPWTITRREFANNLHALARAVTFTVIPLDLIINDSVLLGFVGVCSGCIMFSQQFHAWAHGTKSKLPPIVVALQDVGILVSRSAHGAHHRPPYNNNYCIVSGIWNGVLDKYKVFEVLEMIFFFKTGVRPRSWSEPSYDWIEDTQTSILVAKKTTLA